MIPRPTITRPLFIGIAGGTASGKSTLARRLQGELSKLAVNVIGMDRYFLRKKPTMVGPLNRVVYEDHNHPASFDLEGLIADLGALSTGSVPPQVVIVEGLMTLHDEAIRAMLDLAIYVDTQADERIVRRLRRNMAHGGDYDEIAAFYLESVRYRHDAFVEPSRWHADVVLNGGYPSERGIGMVVEWIRHHAPALP